MFDFLADLCNAFAEGSQNAEALGPECFNFDAMNVGPTNLGEADFTPTDNSRQWEQNAGDWLQDDSAGSQESRHPLQALLNAQKRQRQNLSRQMAAMQHQIVQQHMQDPHVQRMYQHHLAQGGCLSFPAFAHQYAQHIANEQQHQARQRAAWQAWQQAQAQQAGGHSRQGPPAANHQPHFGQALPQGQSQWIDPQTGCGYVLPQHPQPGMVYQDPHTGRQFSRDIHGQYHLWENGWWRPLQPPQNAAA